MHLFCLLLGVSAIRREDTLQAGRVGRIGLETVECLSDRTMKYEGIPIRRKPIRSQRCL
jgi:hypothetical protein